MDFCVLGPLVVRDDEGAELAVAADTGKPVKGERVATAQEIPLKFLENILLDAPEVQEACVIGQPDARWGEAVVAVVVLKPGARLSEAEVMALFQAAFQIGAAAGASRTHDAVEPDQRHQAVFAEVDRAIEIVEIIGVEAGNHHATVAAAPRSLARRNRRDARGVRT